MPNYANGKTSVRVTSMEQTAREITRNSKQILTTEAIPKQVIDSMSNQGMANQSAWGPGTPIDPIQPLGSEPRQFEYTIGQNIVQRPRSTENVSFETMRSIIEMYDVAQMAIEVRQDELRNLDWDIVPDDENDVTKYESEIKRIRAFFEKPDGHMLFDEFQSILAYDWLAFDALSIFPHMTRGGKLGALEVIDGTTITPMIDYYGRTPEAPAPAYVQWVNGMPWTWLSRDQLIYRPHRKRSNKLYGFTPVEWLLNTINTDIRYQLYFLQYFTEGSVPEAWIETPTNMTDPTQIKQFQQMYDAVMMGDQTQKHKVKWIPAGSKVTTAKDTKFDVKFPQFLLNKTCAAFKVTPAELGFTENVNKSSGETQENVHYRRSIKPSAQFFSRIYTGIIHKYFGYTNLRFKFLNIEEQEDLLIQAQVDEIYIRSGVISPDEPRVQRFGFDVDKTNPTPRGIITTKDGFVPLETSIKKAQASIQQLIEQTNSSRIQDGEKPLEPGEMPENTVSPSLETDLAEEEEAQKGMKDFFVSPARSIRTRTSKNG